MPLDEIHQVLDLDEGMTGEDGERLDLPEGTSLQTTKVFKLHEIDG